MMTLEECLERIESREFNARVNVASDLITFLRAVKLEDAVQLLWANLETSMALAKLARRVQDLAENAVDPRYENQWDAAIATYLWLLNLKDPCLASIAAERARTAPQCWWSEKFATRCLLENPARSDSGSGRIDISLLGLSFASEGTPDTVLVVNPGSVGSFKPAPGIHVVQTAGPSDNARHSILFQPINPGREYSEDNAAATSLAA